MLNKIIARILPFFPPKFIWLFSKRYIAGTHIKDAMRESKKLNEQHIEVTVDILGEFIKELSQAEKNKIEYLQMIGEFSRASIKGYFSLKPSMFGLLLDKDVCYKNIREVVKKASTLNKFVRIDMEDSKCTDSEIELFKKLKAEFPNHVGLAIQAYLHRTHYDLQKLSTLNTEDNPLSIRLCKGIYIESHKISYINHQEIRDHFLEDLEYMLTHGFYVGIATHDKYLVNKSYEMIEKHHIPNSQFEFQMLYGVTPKLCKSIIDQGYKMRVYIPYGKEWFGYCTRRLKENPNMAGLIIKALFVRG